jgi:hypothetical protein
VLEDKLHCGRPSSSVNVEATSKMNEMVHADWQITLSEFANEVGVCESAQ